MTTVSDIRLPAVAGLFYPADASELADHVDQLMDGPATASTRTAVRMLLSPHAGYTYSGMVAGRGFHRARAADSTPSRAFVIGPSHVEAFHYTSVFGGTAYRTPLGDVVVDTGAAQRLAGMDSSIRLAGAGHDVRRGDRGEHGIEVQLPFLQRAFGAVSIVPIVMGSQSWEACAALGRALAGIIDWNRDLIVASSDLSHFYDDATARRLDGMFCDTLTTMDASMLYERITRGECEACGAGAVIAALIATSSLPSRACELIATANSGDVSHDRSSVVGYAAAVITS